MKLFYFTYCYPFGMGEQWKANELKILIHHFDEITVVPFFYSGNFDNPKRLPGKVKLLGPLFREISVTAKKMDLFNILFNRHSPVFLKEFFSKKVYKNRTHLDSWIGSTLNVIRLSKHPVIRQLIRDADRDTIWYFYWGKGSSEILPFINTGKIKKTFVRMHRFDLFEYVNSNYIPYRRRLLEKISVAAPSSLAGQLHLQELYPESKDKVKVFRCGTIGNGKISTPSNDHVLRVVSCSGLSVVKRVHLMIESIQYLDFNVVWRHLGGGQLEPELRSLVNRLNLKDKFIFEGMINSEKVIDYYTDNTLDLFVNTSSSEGVPFSIMEAFAAGIPVMATNVGGSGEIVDDSVGRLLPENVTACQLAENIKDYYLLSPDRKMELRKNALARYQQNCNAEKLTDELADFLLAEN
jgi:colanic acid/amylovoran biosynthesis glycosyltransferase